MVRITETVSLVQDLFLFVMLPARESESEVSPQVLLLQGPPQDSPGQGGAHEPASQGSAEVPDLQTCQHKVVRW